MSPRAHQARSAPYICVLSQKHGMCKSHKSMATESKWLCSPPFKLAKQGRYTLGYQREHALVRYGLFALMFLVVLLCVCACVSVR